MTILKLKFSAKKYPRNPRVSLGFTLIELLVSVSIFTIVMLVATSSVFFIIEANKKTHTLKSVMTNLNFALESMMRDIRVGLRYSCDGGGDCAINSGTTFTYKANRDVDGDASYNAGDNNDQIEYSLVDGRIQKRIYGTIPATFLITAEEIEITAMNFYVIGTGDSDGKQPKALITIAGHTGTGSSRSDFNIQTMVSQRALDL